MIDKLAGSGDRSSLRMTDLLRNLVLGIVALSVLASGFLVARISTDTLRERIVNANELIAASIAHETGEFLESARRPLTLLAERELRSTVFIDSLMREYSFYEDILVLDGSGKVVLAPTGSAVLGFDFSRRDFFGAASRALPWSLSPSSISPRGYHPTVSLSVPDGDGAVVAFLNLSSLMKYVKDAPKREGDLVALTDSLGYFIAHSDPGAVERREILRSADDLMEGGALVSEATVAGGWTVYVAQARERIEGPARNSFLAVAAVLLVACVLASVAVALVFRFSTKDFDALLAISQAIAAGDYGDRPPYAGFKDLATLADGFAEAANAVRAREEGLREKSRLLESSLVEKELLIKEIHHRVKNNLQLVSSLLTLQSSSGEDEDSRRVLDDSIARVQAMALIHETLYQSEARSFVSFDEYLRSLAESVVSSYSWRRVSPDLDMDLEKVDMDIDRAVPCGLIVNELITNAIKYAFMPGHPSPRLELALRRLEGRITIVVADNGRGLDPAMDIARAPSLGLKLVTSLAKQLKGTWTLSNEGGARWTISFPDDSP